MQNHKLSCHLVFSLCMSKVECEVCVCMYVCMYVSPHRFTRVACCGSMTLTPGNHLVLQCYQKINQCPEILSHQCPRIIITTPQCPGKIIPLVTTVMRACSPPLGGIASTTWYNTSLSHPSVPDKSSSVCDPVPRNIMQRNMENIEPHSVMQPSRPSKKKRINYNRRV